MYWESGDHPVLLLTKADLAPELEPFLAEAEAVTLGACPLHALPHGGVILDTPGMRELHLWDADLEQTFGDVEEIARRCRFSDCSHESEPGCAVQEALADGTLSRE